MMLSQNGERRWEDASQSWREASLRKKEKKRGGGMGLSYAAAQIIQEVYRENGSSAVIKAAWQLNPVTISTGRRGELQIKV